MRKLIKRKPDARDGRQQPQPIAEPAGVQGGPAAAPGPPTVRLPATPPAPGGSPQAGGQRVAVLPAKRTESLPAAPAGKRTEIAPAAPATTEPSRPARPAKMGRRGGKRGLRRIYLAAAGVGIVAAGGLAYEMTVPSGGGGPVHAITAPQRLGSYAQASALAASMKATQLRNTIVAQSGGEARHVVDAVYEDATGTAGPQIMLFIGGNLSGSSASSFITSFIGRLPNAVITAPGSLGGAAACVPSVAGRPAECAWADNDTFGVVLSPTLSAQQLASELRQMRPQVEHLAK